MVDAAREDRAFADAAFGKKAGLAAPEQGGERLGAGGRGDGPGQAASSLAAGVWGAGAAGRALLPLRRGEELGAAGADLALVMGAEVLVADACELGPQPRVEGRPALGAVEHLAFGLAAPDQLDHRQ